jgi:hypothetical protein
MAGLDPAIQHNFAAAGCGSLDGRLKGGHDYCNLNLRLDFGRAP